MAKKKTMEWWDRYTDEERLAYLRGALAELARAEVPVDVRAEPFSAGAETDLELIAGARSRALALMAERRMLRLAIRELDACTWTWGQPPAGTDGTEESWDLIQAARESVATARKYQIGEAERPEVAALRRELAEAKAVVESASFAADTRRKSLDAIEAALDKADPLDPDDYEDGGYPDEVERIASLAAERDRLTADLAQARADRDALVEAIRWATAADDTLEGGPATTVPDLVARLKHRIARLVETHEAALNELLTTAFAARRAFRGTDRLPNTDEGALHAARDQDDYAALGSSIRTDLTVMTAARMAAERALSRVYLFARAGASLLGSGGADVDRMTTGEAFDVARGALLAIVAESRTWRAGR